MTNQSDAPSLDLRFLDPKQVSLARDEFGRLVLSRPDEGNVVGVKVRQAFPLTLSRQYVALLDAEDVEIGFLADLNEVQCDTRRLIEEELDLEYFMPQILRITAVRSSHGTTTWDLETDRGDRRVYVRDRLDIRYVTATHVVFTDATGVKYEIPDTHRLDLPSCRRLEAQS